MDIVSSELAAPRAPPRIDHVGFRVGDDASWRALLVSAKRASVLELPLEAYKKWADVVERGFLRVARFLRRECLNSPRNLPYRTQLPPLAAVMASLGAERWREPRIYQKLAQWYWNGVLGELYGGAVETRMANDVDELLGWIAHEADLPRTISDATFQVDRQASLTTRLSAAYKGINVLVLREGARDFFWKANIRDLESDEVALDIHHIFPALGRPAAQSGGASVRGSALTFFLQEGAGQTKKATW